MDIQRHRGSTIVITGAGSGLGRATALRLLSEGAVVMALDVSERGLAETEALAVRLPSAVPQTTRGAALHLFVTDVADSSSVQATLSEVFESHPTIDALVNVAGIMDGHLPVHEVDDRTWDRVMAINAGGPMRMLRAVVSSDAAGRRGGNRECRLPVRPPRRARRVCLHGKQARRDRAHPCRRMELC